MPLRSITALVSAWRRYRRGNRGAAAAEFAIVLPILVIPVLNAIDLGIYAYDRMEVNNAAQAAAQVAWSLCAVNGKVPATVTVNGTQNCAGLSAAETTAATDTAALGTSVTISSTTENFYCLSSGGALVTVGSFPNTEPSDCSSVNAGSTDTPGDYVLVTTTYTYTPLFPTLGTVSVASLLTSPITQTAYMRLN